MKLLRYWVINHPLDFRQGDFFSGDKVIDKIEKICYKRALDAFNLSTHEWHVNVQTLSGSLANLCAYNAVLEPGDTIMALCSKVGGGHHTYGIRDANNKPAGLYSKVYNFEYYGVSEDGMIDYEAAYKKALEIKPKLIIAGASTYPREIDWKKFRRICDETGAIMMADIAHGFGLKIAGVNSHPFLYADIVTASASKSMRGPRAGVIYCKKQFAKQIDSSVFPGVMGAPQNNLIGSLAVAFKICSSPEYKEYAERVIDNCQTICYELKKKGNKIVTGGTDTNIMMWDVRDYGVNAKTLMTIGEACNVQF